MEAKTSEAVANGTVASEEATETTTVEAMKEPELDEDEKERRRLQEEEERRREEIVRIICSSWCLFLDVHVYQG